MKKGRLKLAKANLIIDYDVAAEAYFDYELAPKSILSKLAFLGAIATLQFTPGEDKPITGENIEAALGGGRKSFSDLMTNILLCDSERFQILDESKNVLESGHFKFDDIDIEFSDSDADFYDNSNWQTTVDEEGKAAAYIKDIKKYCKVNGKQVTEIDFQNPVSEGGIGWFLGAILLRISIGQGKSGLSIPEPF